MALLKHSNVESGQKWWFLYEFDARGLDVDAAIKEGLNTLKHTKAARFLKRFTSEEELEIEAAVKYGESPIDIDADRKIHAV